MGELIESINFSFRKIKENKRLVMPEIYRFLFLIPLLALTAYVSGAIDVIVALVEVSKEPIILGTGPSAAEITFNAVKTKLIISWIVFFILQRYVIGSSLDAMRYNMVKKGVEGDPIKIKFAKPKHTWNVVGLKLLYDMIKFALLGSVILIGWASIESLIQGSSIGAAGLVGTFLLGILFFLVYMVLVFFTFFRFPMVFLDGMHFAKAMKQSLLFVKKHVLITILAILLIFAGQTIVGTINQMLNLGFRMITLPFVLMLESASTEVLGAIIIGILTLCFLALLFLIGASFTVISDLFVFKTYLITKNNPKNQKRK